MSFLSYTSLDQAGCGSRFYCLRLCAYIELERSIWMIQSWNLHLTGPIDAIVKGFIKGTSYSCPSAFVFDIVNFLSQPLYDV